MSNPRRRLKLLQEALERNDPAFDDNYLLRYAAARGMEDVVKLLLNYSSVDPTAKDNWALILANENQHNEVYNLLAQRLPENYLDTGQISGPNSSQALLLDLIRAEDGVAWKKVQQYRDLQLLVDTSTKILPYLERAISEAIILGKTELAKMMLFFVAFDHSYFNHIVLIRQLMRGNSVKDLRKINPFLHGEGSLFAEAVRSGNVDLANLILDKAIKLNPINFLYPKFYEERYRNLEMASTIASDIIERSKDNSDMVFLRDRLERILNYQAACIVLFLFFFTF
jgi:ankyrin repeat protein